MNIVLYSQTFLPTLGGQEFVIHHLASALLKLGHRVRVLGPAGVWTYRKLKLHYPVHRWPQFRACREPILLAQLVADTVLWGCDVIHAHLTYPNGYTAVRMKSVRNVPLVVTPHGADILTIPDLHFGMRLNRELDRKISRAIRGADVVTAISRTIEAELANMGAETSRIKFVPNGVDTARFNRQPSAGIRSWLELQDDARLIVSVGKYSPRKGFDFLVRAMPLVLATEPRARLVIVGEHTEALLSLISELRLEGKVALTGGLPPPRHILAGATAGAGTEPDRLAEILCSAEVYVSAATETNAEGLSLALLEGMAAGLPIAATAVSGNVDVVVEGENGALAERADERSLAAAILRILGNRQDHERMRNGARQTALRYAWESAARRYVEAYEQAIAVSRSSTRLSSRRDTESDAV